MSLGKKISLTNHHLLPFLRSHWDEFKKKMLNQLYSNLRATPLKISLFFVKSISRNFREIDCTKKCLYYTFSNSISLWQRCNVATSIALMKKNRCLRQCWQAQNLERESRGIETLRGKRYYYTTRDDHFFHTDASTSYTYTCIVILVLVIPSLLDNAPNNLVD